MSTTQQVTVLGSTARWTAAVRARETLRDDRLFNDPWAAQLAGEEGMAWLSRAPESARVNTTAIVVRTRFFDEFLQRTTAEDGVRQIVLVAAGLDTRAYRLTWPTGTHLFELDQAAVLSYKERVLATSGATPACRRTALRTDLRHSWLPALQEVGFNAAVPSVWLLEGFLFYLPTVEGRRILDQVARVPCEGSWMGCDVITSAVLTSNVTRPWIEAMARAGTPWQGTLDDPEAFLAERGWTAALQQPGEEGANFGRWPFPPLPRALPDMPRTWYVTARRTSGFRSRHTLL